MKTTLNLPDDLMRAVKYRAVQESRTLQDTIADLLRRGLAREPSSSQPGRRVQLPLIQCVHPAEASREMTPERVAEALLKEEASASHASL